MGNRHNRKRIRSRHRNRRPKVPRYDQNGYFLPQSSPANVLDLLSYNHNVMQTSQSSQSSQPSQSSQDDEEAQRLRYFGGEASDGVSLCGPMLQVVLDLFEGQLDYDEP